MAEGLEVFAIYDRPKDYPDSYVVRRWVGEQADREPLAVAPSIEMARQALPKDRGLSRMRPFAGDDPVILEVWL
jgi:hypothetical protein